MGFEAWLTICVLGLVIAALMSNRMGMDIALLSGLNVRRRLPGDRFIGGCATRDG